MAGACGYGWTSQFGASPDGDAADTWSAVLADLTPEEIARGIRSTVALGRDFAPGAGRFRALCLGIPSLAAVKNELRTQGERSPFFRLVWSYIDSYRYRMVDADRADRMIGDAYELAHDYVMRGGALPESAGELSAPEPEKKTPASEATVKAAMADIAAKLGGDLT